MNFKLTKYVVAGLLSLSSAAWAESASVLLQSDLQKAVKSFPQDTYFYNYFTLETGGYRLEDTTLKDAVGRQNYVDSRLALGGKTFHDFERRSTTFSNAGPGLYLAVDPYVSSPDAAKVSGHDFGDSMIEVNMRAGTNYLSVFTPVKVSQQTINALIAEGYVDRSNVQRLLGGNRFSRDTLKFMVGYGAENFRKLVADLLANMNVNMIEYAWQSAVAPLCGFKDLRSAFVYIATNRPTDVIDATLVYWRGYPSSIVLSPTESDALNRNRTLRPLLAQLRVLENRYKASGATTRKQIRQEIQSTVNAAYANPGDVENLKRHTYKCN